MFKDIQQTYRAPAPDEIGSLDLGLALDAARTGAWQWDPATDAMSCNSRMRTLCGIPRDVAMTFPLFLTCLRREDRDCTRAALLQAYREGASRSIECRLADSSAGVGRWILMEGGVSALPSSAMHMLGTARDISARKMAESERDSTVREMEHRLGNVFATMISVVSLSERFAATPQQLANSLQVRIGALARAHALLRRARSGDPVSLQEVIEGELAPFTNLSNVSINGPRVKLGGSHAVTMNVIVHELTTNATKHGALSHPDGQLSIDWTIDPCQRDNYLVLSWNERCSHPIRPPLVGSFGLKLLTRSARDGLRGDVLLEFGSTGLTVTLVAPLAHLAEAAPDI